MKHSTRHYAHNSVGIRNKKENYNVYILQFESHNSHYFQKCLKTFTRRKVEHFLQLCNLAKHSLLPPSSKTSSRAWLSEVEEDKAESNQIIELKRLWDWNTIDLRMMSHEIELNEDNTQNSQSPQYVGRELERKLYLILPHKINNIFLEFA